MTVSEKLHKYFIPHLQHQFSRGGVILFTGAGFSCGAENTLGQNLPTARDLTEELWNLTFPDMDFDETTKLQDIFDAALQFNAAKIKDLMIGRFSVDEQRAPQYYRDLISMPWKRIYTLNVDDLVEKAARKVATQRPIRTVSAMTDPVTEIHGEDLCVIHLNGTLRNVPENVVFGRSQYAARSNPDPFYQALRHDLISRPIVFIGSNLEEGPMWQHLALRGGRPKRGQRELRPRNYLVTPSLNPSKVALLSQYQIEWLPMTTEAFCAEVVSKMAEARTQGNTFLHDQYRWSKEYRFQIKRIADIPRGVSKPTEYLLGAEPEWVDVIHNRVVHRECFGSIVEIIDRIRASSSGNEYLIVTGTAGTGKSSAMMAIAIEMEANDVASAWVDNSQRLNRAGLRKALERDPGIRLLFITDADVYGKALKGLIQEALQVNPQLVVVCECRSTKVERITDPSATAELEAIEYTIPNLEDNDIDKILDVLEREKRLGVLRKLSHRERRQVFEAEAGRQMLVAMYKATSGEELKDRAVTEFSELEEMQKFLYGLVSVAHAHRFMLKKDEIGIACGDDVEAWPRALDRLIRRRVIVEVDSEFYRARHREIAQIIYIAMTQHGSIDNVVRALIRVAATKAGPHMHRRSRPIGMLVAFVNHNFMQQTVGTQQGRNLYNEFEHMLEWDHHYWLHRGALELEAGSLGLAENFLQQAKSIEPNDFYIDAEIAYLQLKKAISAPQHTSSQSWVDSAIETLSFIASTKHGQRAHVAHIAGSQGLIWVQVSGISGTEKQQFLERILRLVEKALPDDRKQILPSLARDIQRELLLMAALPGK